MLLLEINWNKIERFEKSFLSEYGWTFSKSAL